MARRASAVIRVFYLNAASTGKGCLRAALCRILKPVPLKQDRVLTFIITDSQGRRKEK